MEDASDDDVFAPKLSQTFPTLVDEMQSTGLAAAKPKSDYS